MTTQTTSTNSGTSNAQLKQYIEQIERLEEEKKGIADDIRDKFAEAKAVGFDPKAMKVVIKKRKQSKAEREEMEQIIATYEAAVGL